MASPTTSSSNTNTRAQIAQQPAKSTEATTPSTSPTSRISQENSLFLSDLDGGMAAVVISTPPSVKKTLGGFEKGGERKGKMEVQQQAEGEEGGDGEEWMPVTPKGRKTRLVSKAGSQPSTPEGKKSRAVLGKMGGEPATPERKTRRLVSKAGSLPTTPESRGKDRVITQTQPEAARSPPPSPWSPGRTYAQALMGNSPTRMDLEKAKERAQGMAVLFGGGRGVVAEPVVGKGGEKGAEQGDADVAMEEMGREEIRWDSVETVIVVDKEEMTSGSGDEDEKESESLEQSSSADASETKGQEQDHEQEQEQQPLDPPEASTTAYRISTTTEQEQPVLDQDATAANADAGDADDDNKSVASNQSSVFSDEEKDENGETATRENALGLVEVEVNEEETKQQANQGVDETSTPRILTYVSLHNEVKPQPTPYQNLNPLN